MRLTWDSCFAVCFAFPRLDARAVEKQQAAGQGLLPVLVGALRGFAGRARNSWRIALECKFVGACASTMSIGAAQFRLHRVDVAFMVHIDQVARRIALRRANVE